MTPDEIIALLQDQLSPLVMSERTVSAHFDEGLAPGPRRAHVVVYFVNLPVDRARERRGGGAENENNIQLFFINGLNSDGSGVDKVEVEQLKNSIGDIGKWAPRMRKKTGTPDKVVAYLAKYINQVAESFAPKHTHD